LLHVVCSSSLCAQAATLKRENSVNLSDHNIMVSALLVHDMSV
jgi:hypothetical protein